MGPLVGAIGGLGTWLVLILKSAFALIGLGAYVGILFPQLPIMPVALALAVGFGVLNLLGAKKTGSFQIILVAVLILILVAFSVVGIPAVKAGMITGMFDAEFGTLLGTVGLVYISYAGLTKVTSVAEEVENPERNIALGMFLALITAVLFYGVGTWIMISVVPAESLAGDLTPVASAAARLVGDWGVYAVVLAAVLGFFAMANAGILSASRFPLAMSRDSLLPGFFKSITGDGTPRNAVIVTVLLTMGVILAFDPLKIAKLAGAFQLMIFSLLCLAVIVMRESRIESYDPGFSSPLYPWLQLVGIVVPAVIIARMGTLSILFSLGLLILTILWYFYYAADKVQRDGAIYHWFARLGERQYAGLDRELRGILKEKGLRSEDPFDEIVARAGVVEARESDTYEDIVHRAAVLLSTVVPKSDEKIEHSFLEGTRVGATPVTHGVALPHFRVSGLGRPEMILVRSRAGIHVVANDPLLDEEEEHDVNAFFFLVSAEEDPGQHLRLLAQIAGRVDDPEFMKQWLGAGDEQELKEVLLRDERFLSLTVTADGPTEAFIGRPLREIDIPEACLVAMIRRSGDILVPRGNTVLREGDRLTVIGEPKGLESVRKRYRN
jgi:amino acid transporter/mannitol/fructose-specific phosphotransferase system IIA component (Ntr-type)